MCLVVVCLGGVCVPGWGVGVGASAHRRHVWRGRCVWGGVCLAVGCVWCVCLGGVWLCRRMCVVVGDCPSVDGLASEQSTCLQPACRQSHLPLTPPTRLPALPAAIDADYRSAFIPLDTDLQGYFQGHLNVTLALVGC